MSDEAESVIADRDELCARGRQHYERREWADAYARLSEADERAPLGIDDLELLANAAEFSGHVDEAISAMERLFHACCETEQADRAAFAAFLIGFRLMTLGEVGRGTGWLGRAQRQVERAGEECVVRGYLMLPPAHRHFMTGDLDQALSVARAAGEIGERCGDPDLLAFARNMEGRALVRMGKVKAGLALLDEAMLPTASRELSPLFAGLIYCSVIATCRQCWALDRAREWTEALASWCDEQPQLVPFTGSCLVHRAEVMSLGGHWSQAVQEAQSACDRFANTRDPEAVGSGYYEQAEVFRLRGDFERAEDCYKEASRYGTEAHPGLALLRLATGDVDTARAAIRRVLEGTTKEFERARFLPACVEIMLAAGDLEAAQQASEELGQLARFFDTEILWAIARHANGAVKLAQGDNAGAVALLREAFATWHKAGAPYLAAKIRVQLARAYRALGDEDGARMELDAAGAVFEDLGAAPDLKRLNEIGTAPQPAAKRQTPDHGLTARELEVLRLVARGMTNKAIAAELGISERTIDRHMSNIFLKLELSSRTALTAFAYEKGLV